MSSCSLHDLLRAVLAAGDGAGCCCCSPTPAAFASLVARDVPVVPGAVETSDVIGVVDAELIIVGSDGCDWYSRSPRRSSRSPLTSSIACTARL